MDFELLIDRIKDEYKYFVVNKLKMPENSSLRVINEKISLLQKFEGNIEEAFNMYFLLLNLANNGKKKINQASNALKFDYNDQITLNALEFFKSNTGNIEILFQNKLNRVFFPLHPVCKNLSKETRTELMTEIKRDTPQSKIMVRYYS